MKTRKILPALIMLTSNISPGMAQTGISAQKLSPAPASSSKTTASPPSSPAVTQPVPSDLPRAVFIKQMDNDFSLRDSDQDRRATRAEIEFFERKKAFALAQEKNRLLFIQLDGDRNGMISQQEFSNLITAPSSVDVSAFMEKFDANRDQIVSLIEYRTRALLNFDDIDADKDGVISSKELEFREQKVQKRIIPR